MPDTEDRDSTPPERPEPGETHDARLAALLHDLRTPLSAMKTASEVIGLDPLNDRQARALHTLELAIDALLSMTQGFLDAPDGPARAIEPGNAGEEIEATVDLFMADARARGLNLTARLSPDLESYALGDPLTLRRILSVLLDNALKYTGEGSVQVTADVERGGARPMLVLDLTDTGIGIPEDERADLFRPRRRGSRARSTASGSGLGLWSAARLATSAGGRLDLLDSSAAGTTFGLRLPLTAPAPASVETQGSNIGPLPLRRVLVVDDNAANRQMMQAMLEAFGLEVVLAEGGHAALTLLEAHPVDAVLLDINMPGMDGVETVSEIRKRSDTDPHLPVIGITAALLPGSRVLERAGFDAVLDKPVAPAVLFDTLDRLMRDASRG